MSPEKLDRQWWLAKGAPHDGVVANARHLKERSRARHEMDRRHMRLYGGAQYAGLTPSQYAQVLPHSERVAWNVIASVIDTYVAKMSKSTPAPMFLTNGADYKTRRKAEKLNKFGKGVLHQSGAYRISPTLERDAGIFGTGILQVYGEGTKRLRAERVFPWELLVDDIEAMYGEPRSLYRVKNVDRTLVVSRFGAKDEEKRRKIEAAPGAKDAGGRTTLSEQVEVFEAWHLPSSPKADDGRHVIVVEGCTLVDEPWKRERFPFAIRRYTDPVAGWWGIGIAERLTGIQIEINKLLLRIQQAHHMLGRPIVILDEASGIPETHITNEVAAIVIKNAGAGDFRVDTSPTMPGDVYAHLMTLLRQAYEEIGVSQLDASAKKPAGLDSGVALREFNDIGSERFLPQGKRREEFFLDVVRISLDEVREMPDFSVDVPDRKFSEHVEWKDVDLDDEAYTLQCFPTSMLPQTPAGRLQQVQEFIASGLIPQEFALELLDIPDLDDYRSRATAPLNAVRARVNAILDGGKYEAPEAFDDPRTILAYTLPTYLEERENGAPEDVLRELRRYLNEAIRLQTMAAKPPAPAAPMGVDPAAMSALPTAVPAMQSPTDPLSAGMQMPMGSA